MENLNVGDRAQQRAIKAAQGAIGAIRYGDFARAKDLLAEAARHVDTIVRKATPGETASVQDDFEAYQQRVIADLPPKKFIEFPA